MSSDTHLGAGEQPKEKGNTFNGLATQLRTLLNNDTDGTQPIPPNIHLLLIQLIEAYKELNSSYPEKKAIISSVNATGIRSLFTQHKSAKRL